MNRLFVCVVASVVMLITSGCVTGRRSIELAVPAAATEVAATKGTLAIAAVSDLRKFEPAPPAPSTPSVNGDLSKTGKETLSTLIGRQRNGFGKAMGDVALAGGETVQGRMRALIEQAFRQRGYGVAAAGAGEVTAEADVNKFWGWFSPGFASVSFEAELSSVIRLTRDGTTQTLTVNGYGKNSGQIASDANWQLAFSRAFEDFLRNLDSALAGAGF